MTAQKIQENISFEDMFNILEKLGAEPIKQNDDIIVCKTICHNGDSHKLYYYDNSKRFTCFTGECGFGFSIYDLIQKVKGISFKESYDIITKDLNIDVEYNNRKADVSFFKKFNKSKEDKKLKQYNQSILNVFNRLYHRSWLDDNISSEAMKKHYIMFNILNNQIVIPHFDKDYRLCGVRVRNLNKEDVDKGMKYMPLHYAYKSYKHNTGLNLYGLNFSIDNIKKYKKIIIFESEKACMQYETYFPNQNISVALSGGNLSDEQIELINNIDIGLEVIVALDKEYHEVGDKYYDIYARKIKKNFIDRLNKYHKVSIIWDLDNLLDYKDAPTDKGKEIFIKLLDNRILTW